MSDGAIERVVSGIPGLDGLIGGGIPKGSLVLLTGGCGTGKTIFGMQFLNYGATHGEPGVYVSLEEPTTNIIKDASLFGWDVEGLIKAKKFGVDYFELYDFKKLKDAMDAAIDRVRAERVVIDSAALLGLFFEDRYKFRRSLIELAREFRQKKVTALMISEVPEGSHTLSAFGVEEYVVDGVLVLHYEKVGNVYMRALTIRKMRETAHSSKVHPVKIGDTGMGISAAEEVFLP